MSRRANTEALLCITILVLVCGALFLIHAGTQPLTDPDESRCAMIVRDMMRTGDWIVPHFDGEVYYDKPAPYFWLAALGTKLTGNDELGGRIVSAVAALLTVLATFSLSRRLLGTRGAMLAALVLATSGEFLYIARWYRMDMPFTAGMWAALWWFWRTECRRKEGRPYAGSWQWIGFYFFCSIATLFKGPAGLALPTMIVVVYLVLAENPRRLLGLLHPGAIILYLLIAAPWYLAMNARIPNYLYEFLLHQNVARYATETLGHDWPGIVYVPILIGGMLPWAVYLPGIAVRDWPRLWKERKQDRASLFLWLSALLPFLFFVFCKTKLASYILPVFPPLAILVARLVATWAQSVSKDAMMRRGAWVLVASIVLMLVAAAVGERLLGQLDSWVLLPGGLILACAWKMAVSLRREDRPGFAKWALLGGLLNAFFIIGYVAPAAFDTMSKRALVRAVNPACFRGAQFCCYPYDKWSFPYYAGADHSTRFKTNAEGTARVVRLLQSKAPVVCMVSDRSNLQRLQTACRGQLELLAGLNSTWIVANPPAAALGKR